MVHERKPVEQRDPWKPRYARPYGQLPGGQRVERGRRDAHRGIWTDEHDLVCRQQLDRLRTVSQDSVHLLHGQVHEERVVRDLANLGLVVDLATGDADDLVQMRLGGCTLLRVASVPQLDFDEHGADGLAHQFDVLAPDLDQTCVANPIGGAPPTDRTQLLECCAEPRQTVFEGHGLIGLPLLKQADELGHRFRIRHDEVQGVLHHVIGSAVLAADHVEIVIGLGSFIEELRQELKTLDPVDGVVEVLHAAREVEDEDEFGVNLVDMPIGKLGALVVEGFHKCSKLWREPFTLARSARA
jgi:hypothetical protein